MRASRHLRNGHSLQVERNAQLCEVWHKTGSHTQPKRPVLPPVAGCGAVSMHYSRAVLSSARGTYMGYRAVGVPAALGGQPVSGPNFHESIYVCGCGVLYLWFTWHFNKSAGISAGLIGSVTRSLSQSLSTLSTSTEPAWLVAGRSEFYPTRWS